MFCVESSKMSKVNDWREMQKISNFMRNKINEIRQQERREKMEMKKEKGKHKKPQKYFSKNVITSITLIPTNK